MKILIVLCLALAVKTQDMNSEWEDFKQRYAKSYQDEQEEVIIP